MDWVKLVNVGTALEADILVAQLDAAGIDAVTRGNDIVGLFGPGFQGVTARGVDVLVAPAQLDEARDILSEIRARAAEPPDDE